MIESQLLGYNITKKPGDDFPSISYLDKLKNKDELTNKMTINQEKFTNKMLWHCFLS